MLAIYVGPMKSDKTTTLLRALDKAARLGCKTLYINSILDTRNTVFNDDNVSTNSNSLKFPDTITYVKTEFLADVDITNYDYIGVDECQYYKDLVPTVEGWLDSTNKHFMCVGLDGSFMRKPIGNILELVPRSYKTKKLNAECEICKNDPKNRLIKTPAPFTRKIAGSNSILEAGGDEMYLAVCKDHYTCEIITLGKSVS